jgi:hypothetical protein
MGINRGMGSRRPDGAVHARPAPRRSSDAQITLADVRKDDRRREVEPITPR